MMRWLVGSSSRFRGLVVGVAAGIVVLGVARLPSTPADTPPEFKRPTVEVQTEALGLSAEAVAAAGLPEVAKPPQMLQPLSSTSRVAMVRLVPEELSPIEVSVLARWVIVPRLLGVPGVANVAIWASGTASSRCSRTRRACGKPGSRSRT